MHLSDLISPERIRCNLDAQSKKRALEQLSELISQNQDTITSTQVFDSLLSRERLGGTGVGHGVAIPHGRLRNSQKALGAFIKLAHGVDYDAADKQPVDLLFALLVPEESTEEHLQILAQLAAMFSDESMREKLRHAEDTADIHELLLAWQNSHS
ncbi:MAG: PTS IIA-like nitrogen regulatory protein PtsN [Gammaproteobacteria bacterium]|nr:PTS IIA-like nitrogen regulatory protein PtsN [Gammaproteobacteria bacterium]